MIHAPSDDGPARDIQIERNIHPRESHAVHQLLDDAESHAAALEIQRAYRGYRTRQRMNSMRMDASTRWLDAINEVLYRQATAPTSRAERDAAWTQRHRPPSLRARDRARANWKRAIAVAKRAGAPSPVPDPESDTDPSTDLADDSASPSVEQRAARRQHRAQAQREREHHAKTMELQYFLELVDAQHRSGTNLRAYHAVWKRAHTVENFFHWLDRGDGRGAAVATVSRARLAREKVRYLSREERGDYLVRVDREGRLRCARTGERVTTVAGWQDSMGGMVSGQDKASPVFPLSVSSGSRASTSSSSSCTSDSSGGSEHWEEEDGFPMRKPWKKYTQVSPATILNYLLRSVVKAGSWIFVADTNFRLYIGLKQSGSFQHSSFLHGSRVAAAGLIKVKDGLIRRLSPLSGHYRPPTANFRAFVRSLRDAGADLSHVSIPRSYAVLAGLEAYVRTRRQMKKGMRKLEASVVRAVRPHEGRKVEDPVNIPGKEKVEGVVEAKDDQS